MDGGEGAGGGGAEVVGTGVAAAEVVSTVTPFTL